LFKIINNNISFLLIASAAFLGMLSTLIVKKYLPNFFISYSLFITFIGIVNSFGLLGFDQVFLRLSEKNNNYIYIEKRLYLLILISGFLFPFFTLLFFLDSKMLNFLMLLLTGWSINTIIFAYNLFRVKESFIYSQIIKNSFKFFFFIIIVFFILFKIKNFILILYLFVFSLSLIGLVVFFNIKKYIRTKKENTPHFYKLYFSFLINIGLITLLGFGERLLIKEHIGEVAFGKYFYYLTIFIFPLTLIQQYVGFKELVFFKKKIEKKQIFKKVLITIMVGILITLFTILIVIIDNGRFLEIDIYNEKKLILSLFILGIVKLIYSLFSAVLGAKGEHKDIFTLNIVTIIFIVISYIVLLNLGFTLVYIIYCLSLIFAVRILFVYLKYVK